MHNQPQSLRATLLSSLTKPFQLFEHDKENQPILNTHRKPTPQQRSHSSKFNSSEDQYNSRKSQQKLNQLQKQVQELARALAQRDEQLKLLVEEKNCFKLICQKQQMKLAQSNSRDLEMLREDYKQQVEELKTERQRMATMVQHIKQEHHRELENQREAAVELNNLVQKLKRDMNMLIKQRDEFKKEVDRQSSKLLEKDRRIAQISQELDQKRNIERKYRLALRELERLDERARQSDF